MKRFLLTIAFLFACCLTTQAQFSSHTSFRFRIGSALPSTCDVGDNWYKTGASAGQYNCSATNTWTAAGGSPSGSITASGYTQSTNKLLGRGTASTGAIEEITLGTNLSLSGTTLNATGGATNSAPEDTIPVTTDGDGNLGASKATQSGNDFLISTPNAKTRIGDPAAAGNGTELAVDDGQQEVRITAPGGNIIIGAQSGAHPYVQVDQSNNAVDLDPGIGGQAYVGRSGVAQLTVDCFGDGTITLATPTGAGIVELRAHAVTGTVQLTARRTTVSKALKLTPMAFASIPASPEEGDMVWVNNSTTAVWGDTIAGGGANKVLAVYNGTVWTVAGK